MPEESAISLKNRVDPHVAKSHNRPVLKPRPPIQRNNCWTEKENTAFIDTAVRGWTCCPIYLIKRISDHDNEEEMMDDVFDGAHKIEAIINFIDNKYALCKLTEDTSPLKNYENQYFRDLPRDIRNRILDYKFMINYIISNNKIY